jgi:hypothetical protein
MKGNTYNPVSYSYQYGAKQGNVERIIDLAGVSGLKRLVVGKIIICNV